MKQTFWIAALVLAVLTNVDSAVADDQLLKMIDEVLNEPTRLVAEWEQKQTVALFVTGSIAVFGGIIAMIQAAAWPKLLTALLGIVVSVFTGIGNLYLDFDHRQYRSLASQGRHALSDIRIKKSMLAQIPAEDKTSRNAIFEDIRKEANDVLTLPERFKERPHQTTQKAGNDGLIIGSAYAQGLSTISGLPEWITKPPNDDTNLYFVGYADARDFVGAREESRESAMAEARTFLAFRFEAANPKVAIDNNAVAKYLIESARIDRTHYIYDKSKKYYRFFTLLALSRKVAESDLRLFAGKSGLSASPELQKSLQSASRTQSDYLFNRLQVYAREIEKAQGALAPAQYDRFSEARNLRRERKPGEAAAILRELVKARPDFYLGWFNLALAYDDANNFEAARSAYERAAAIERQQNIGDASLYNSYGYFLYRHKKYSEAIPNLQKALDISGDHPKARNTLIATKAAMGQKDR